MATLAPAQLAVARSHGFPSWPALHAAVTGGGKPEPAPDLRDCGTAAEATNYPACGAVAERLALAEGEWEGRRTGAGG